LDESKGDGAIEDDNEEGVEEMGIIKSFPPMTVP
jgi:hypothetical protein